MAERRMFAKSLIDSDLFLDMPLSTQALYFHLSMRADDEGFVNNPKKILRMIGANEDGLRILIAKQFILPFDSGIVVIKHWRIHNYIQKDRFKATTYTAEKELIVSNKNGEYDYKSEPLDTECIHDVSTMDTQVRLGKVRLGKESIEIRDCEEDKKGDKLSDRCMNADKKAGKTANLADEIENYTTNSELSAALNDYFKMRKAMKTPNTERAIKLCFSKLDSLASTDEEKLRVVEQSIERGWKTFYPLKDKKPETYKQPTAADYDFSDWYK